MTAQTPSMLAFVGTLRLAHFAMMDRLRRAQGDALDALGLGPRECSFKLLRSGPHWRLRAYGGPDAAPPLVMVPAPIKRPYIWDLTPSVSAVRYCLNRGFRVYLLEWMPPEADGGADLDAYTGLAIDACVAAVSNQTGGVRHSSWVTRLAVRSRPSTPPSSLNRSKASCCLGHHYASSRHQVDFEMPSSR